MVVVVSNVFKLVFPFIIHAHCFVHFSRAFLFFFDILFTGDFWTYVIMKNRTTNVMSCSSCCCCFFFSLLFLSARSIWREKLILWMKISRVKAHWILIGKLIFCLHWKVISCFYPCCSFFRQEKKSFNSTSWSNLPIQIWIHGVALNLMSYFHRIK